MGLIKKGFSVHGESSSILSEKKSTFFDALPYRRDNCVTNLFFNGERKIVTNVIFSTMERGKLAKVLFQLNFVLYFSESRCLGRKATATHPTTPTTAAQMNIPE